MDFDPTVEGPIVWLIGASIAVYFLYKWMTREFDFFVRRGISGPKPAPIVGNMWGIWKRDALDYDHEMTKKYGKTFGVFDGSLPNLVTSDADMVRFLLVKGFDHFVNRRDFGGIVNIKYFRKMLTVTQNQEWKDIRSAVTPTFTSGKIKRMSSLITKCTEELVAVLTTEAQNGGRLDAKKIFSIFTMDVIAKCAFGLNIENLADDDDPFLKNAKGTFNSDLFKSPTILIPFILRGRFINMLSEKYLVTEEEKYMIDLVVKVIEERKQSNQVYNDFIETGTEAVQEVTKLIDGKKVPAYTKEETDEIIVAQSVIFLLAGFDTTAATLTHTSYLLAKNPETQEKLYDQVMSKLEQYGEVSHDMILDFPYLDQIINEVLRMYSPVVRLERECTKDITYNGIHMKKGMVVSVATYPLHYSEEYYSEPQKFDPDRWAPENKHKINPYAYAPFGLGPRNCVGMRFAMEELKIALCSVVSKVKFVPTKETPDKLTFDKGLVFVVQTLNAIVGVELR